MSTSDATLLLRRLSDGDQAAGDQLLELVYAELHGLASSHMRRQSPQHTLQPTALVNEAWMKLVRLEDPNWTDRSHFFKVSARAMRSVLIDHVRTKEREKRGGGERHALFEDAVASDGVLEQRGPLDFVALDDSLKRLEAFDATMAELVELRFFGGRTMEETAECLGVSLSTAERTWRLAKAWLYREMGDAAAS